MIHLKRLGVGLLLTAGIGSIMAAFALGVAFHPKILLVCLGLVISYVGGAAWLDS